MGGRDDDAPPPAESGAVCRRRGGAQQYARAVRPMMWCEVAARERRGWRLAFFFFFVFPREGGGRVFCLMRSVCDAAVTHVVARRPRFFENNRVRLFEGTRHTVAREFPGRAPKKQRTHLRQPGELRIARHAVRHEPLAEQHTSVAL